MAISLACFDKGDSSAYRYILQAFLPILIEYIRGMTNVALYARVSTKDIGQNIL